MAELEVLVSKPGAHATPPHRAASPLLGHLSDTLRSKDAYRIKAYPTRPAQLRKAVVSYRKMLVDVYK